ncbi:MAG: DUF4143 domain-containing protein [Bifidobacteriaceae bacterium]|nr:DUF4143 domain-containing protein [Bifidobacteriaceae bacterium]
MNHLIKLLPVYTKNTDVRERTPKKVYFIDNGIVNINADISGGAKFENSIHMQLLKYGKLYFYNTKDGEIDFILKTYDSIFAFEVKETPTDKYLKTLNRRASKLDIEKISLIGRCPIATFSNYIWGARI